MTYVTENTIWPDYPISPEVKAVLELFFTLADLNCPEAGPRLAAEVFSPTAAIVAGASKTTGTDAIANSRKHAWAVISKRRHHIVSVYLRNADANDLLVIGELDAELKNGKSVTAGFCARCVIDDSTSENAPKFSLYQVWTDPTQLQQAIKECQEG